MTLVERLIAIIAPLECLACGAEGSLACEACLPSIIQPVARRCYRCRDASAASLLCRACKSKTDVRFVWSCSVYAGLAMQLVHALKFGRVQQAVVPMAVCMDKRLPYYSKWVVVPVPTAVSRVRVRGYDQSAVVARAFSRRRGLVYAPVLRRMGHTRQLGANRATRLHQLAGAYRVVRRQQVQGKHVLLVDDVMTTGATIEAAARCLQLAGAATVAVVVFAHKQ